MGNMKNEMAIVWGKKKSPKKSEDEADSNGHVEYYCKGQFVPH